jgi:hypothetical protein
MGCEGAVAGSGNVKSEARTPGPFSEIEVRGDYEVSIRLQADGHRIAVDGDDNLLPEVRTTTNGKRLLIERARSIRPTRRIGIVIAAPDLTLCRCLGSVAVRVSDVRNARFQVDLDGSGSAEAEGSTENLKVFVNGSGSARLEKLACKRALVNVNGSGSADIASPELLEVEIHGSARVSYGGSPKIEQTVRGSGQLVKR